MAGAFSGHLLNAFNNASAQPSIVTSGATSFDARVHGSPAPSSPMPHPFASFAPLSDDSATAKQIATLQAKLDKKLGPEYISQRPGPGGGPRLTYAEGWKIINLANEVFGFNGWSSSIVNITTDFIDYIEESKRFNVGVTAIIRVTLRDGAYHEDVGYGVLENGRSKAGALDKCKKEAITDALKRTLRNFGNLLGNCLYDKSYTQEVVKIKVPPAKFDKSELYRRPEFAERTLETQTPTSNRQTAVPEASSAKRDGLHVKVEHDGHQSETPITYIPRHLRQEVTAAAQQAQAETPVRAPPLKAPSVMHKSTSGSGSSAVSGAANLVAPQSTAPKPNGLVTPVQTPIRAQRPPPPRASPLQAVATSPLAQALSTSERNVSFAEPLPVPICVSSADAADHDVDSIDQGNGDGDEEDAYPLSTQDGAFFATVELGEGDLGRPIDFEEGTSGVNMMDASVLQSEVDGVEQSSVVPPDSRFQVRNQAESVLNTGLSSGGPLKADTRSETQAKYAAVPLAIPGNLNNNSNPNSNLNAGGGQQQQQSWSRPSDASLSSSRTGHPAQDIEPFRPPIAPMGGFHFPLGVKLSAQQQPQQYVHTSKPLMLASPSVRATPNITQMRPANALKRSMDVMMAVSTVAASTRPPPLQGMGLAQRQQQQNTSARSPSDRSEGNDPKRLKR